MNSNGTFPFAVKICAVCGGRGYIKKELQRLIMCSTCSAIGKVQFPIALGERIDTAGREPSSYWGPSPGGDGMDRGEY